MGYYPDAVGHRMERKDPDDDLIIYCSKGRGRLRIGEWCGDVLPGQVMLLPKGLRHYYEAHEDEPWTLFWVHVNGTVANTFLRHIGLGENQPVVTAGLSPVLEANFFHLMEVRLTGYSDRAFIRAANQLRHLLSQMALEARSHHRAGRSGLDVYKVQAFMQQNIYRNLTLEQLAAIASMSKYHFSMRYKEVSGYSPVRHFLNMKMEHACYLLDSTPLSVSAVANRLGYADPLYFSRLFSRTVGQSPRAYRASIRKD